MSLDLGGRVALVTGTSRGIGYFLAKGLAAAGRACIAVARTQGGLEELDDEIKSAGGSATLVPLDLADMAGIDRLGGAIHERWGKLDVLFANAAILGVIAPIGHVEAKVFERVMQVNVTATWRLIRAVDPLLNASDAGRAILMSSSLGTKVKPFWGPYAASKAAVEALGGPGRLRRRTRRCGLTWLTRAQPEPRCGRRRCRAKTLQPLLTPEL